MCATPVGTASSRCLSGRSVPAGWPHGVGGGDSLLRAETPSAVPTGRLSLLSKRKVGCAIRSPLTSPAVCSGTEIGPRRFCVPLVWSQSRKLLFTRGRLRNDHRTRPGRLPGRGGCHVECRLRVNRRVRFHPDEGAHGSPHGEHTQTTWPSGGSVRSASGTRSSHVTAGYEGGRPETTGLDRRAGRGQRPARSGDAARITGSAGRGQMTGAAVSRSPGRF